MTTTSLSPVRRLLNLLQLESNDLRSAILFSLAIGILSLAVPIATQALVNTVAFGNLMQPLAVMSLIVLALMAVAGILQLIRYHLVEMLQRRVFVRLASESVHRLLNARIDGLRREHGPEIVNRFLDIVTIQKAGATLLIDGLSVVTQTVAGMLLLAAYHPWLLAFDAALFLALVIVLLPAGRGAVETAIGESKAKYALVGWMEEIARNATTFRGAAESQFAAGRCDELVRRYLSYRSSHFRILLRQLAGSLVLQAGASAALLGVGGLLVINRQLTLGQLVAAELVVAAVLTGISKLAKHLEIFYDLLASLDKLGSLTDIAQEPTGAEPVSGQGPAVISVTAADWELRLSAGEKVALEGAAGAGKSRLLEAVSGYGELEDASIAWDGVDLRSLALRQIRSHAALVKEIEIFHGSVLDNVRVGREVSAADVQHALEQAGIWDAVRQLPGGLNAILATGGDPLSAGQKQALMVARAILGRPRLLMIDGALDAAGNERAALADLIFDSRAPWTLLLVTSREDLQRRCSRVVPVGRTGWKEAA